MKYCSKHNNDAQKIKFNIMYKCLYIRFLTNTAKKLFIIPKTRSIFVNHIAMIFIFTLCFTLTFAHTVTGSPGDGMLCPISDSEYIDDNQNTVNEYYECPDPMGDLARTACCIEEEPKEENRNHEDLALSIIKGDTRHKCCLPPIPLDSVLKVKNLNYRYITSLIYTGPSKIKYAMGLRSSKRSVIYFIL